MKGLRIGDKIDSDHHSVEVKIEGKKRGKKEVQQGRVGRGIWNEGRKFKKKMRPAVSASGTDAEIAGSSDIRPMTPGRSLEARSGSEEDK